MESPFVTSPEQVVVRMGECNHCGWCCQYDGVVRSVIHKPQEEDKRFYLLRGARFDQEKNVLHCVTHLHVPCTAHDVESKRCTVYENRPLPCQKFPEVPEQIEGTPCSHWFELRKGDVVLARRGGMGSPFPTIIS